MGKLSSKMWKALGAQTSRNQSRSIELIKGAKKFDDWARELADDDFADTARTLDIFAAKSEDRAKYLALVSEASRRSLKLDPFDVQLQGALRLLEGDVIEMATGEGKTLAGALAAVGFALADRQVHIISVNDYLAKRDAETMAPLFEFLGIRVAYINEVSTREERQAAYKADVLYGSVNEIGFDVLRDQLATSAADLVVTEQDVAIIDEADSVLVDEALVPLVLAGATTSQVPPEAIMTAVSKLRKGRHFDVDQEERNVFLTDEGATQIEEELGGISLYDEEHVGTTLVQVNIALHAHILVERDIHYIVRDGEVKLINSSRGRIAELQRWPDGLQAAVEVKEGLTPSDEGEVIDTLTVQALIGRYNTVCGMTGTALAAGEQLRQFYGLAVSPIPPNTPNIRKDDKDRVFDNKANKAAAIVNYVAEVHQTGRPILIGTHDVAESEEICDLLDRAGVKAVVLNAKNDAEEARIIAEAGAKNAVTVSTQMAGRGTDIKLGGSQAGDGTNSTPDRDEVIALGGLLVIGTGRHDTERLDNQLRGRAGRQGDPGQSIFFSSLEDPVVTRHMALKKMPTNTDDHGEFTNDRGLDVVDQAQRIAEGMMLELHANTWRYNQLVNQQRDIIEKRRYTILTTDAALEQIKKTEPDRYRQLSEDDGIPDTVLVDVARQIALFHLDRLWAEHLAFVEDVKSSIHLRALGRESPLDEFHRNLVAEFNKLPREEAERVRNTFTTATITADGVDLEAEDMNRSTLTWTYLVHDNPFSSKAARALQGIIGAFR